MNKLRRFELPEAGTPEQRVSSELSGREQIYNDAIDFMRQYDWIFGGTSDSLQKDLEKLWSSRDGHYPLAAVVSELPRVKEQNSHRGIIAKAVAWAIFEDEVVNPDKRHAKSLTSEEIDALYFAGGLVDRVGGVSEDASPKELQEKLSVIEQMFVELHGQLMPEGVADIAKLVYLRVVAGLNEEEIVDLQSNGVLNLGGTGLDNELIPYYPGADGLIEGAGMFSRIDWQKLHDRYSVYSLYSEVLQHIDNVQGVPARIRTIATTLGPSGLKVKIREAYQEMDESERQLLIEEGDVGKALWTNERAQGIDMGGLSANRRALVPVFQVLYALGLRKFHAQAPEAQQVAEYRDQLPSAELLDTLTRATYERFLGGID